MSTNELQKTRKPVIDGKEARKKGKNEKFQNYSGGKACKRKSE